MTKSIKKSISILLAVLMTIGMIAVVPFTASADSISPVSIFYEEITELNEGDTIDGYWDANIDMLNAALITVIDENGDTLADKAISWTADRDYTVVDSEWDYADEYPGYDNAYIDYYTFHVQKKYALKGTFNDNWNVGDEFVDNGEGVLTVTKELAAGTYEFKINSGDKWYGNNGQIADTTTTSSQNGWVFDENSGNCKLIASGGTYTFQLNTADMKLTVLYTAPPEPQELPDVIKDCTYVHPVGYIFCNVPLVTQSIDEMLDGAVFFDAVICDTMHYSYKFYDENGTDITPALVASYVNPGEVFGFDESVSAYIYDYGFSTDNIPNPLYIVATAPAEPAPAPVYSLKGQFNDWTAEAFTEGEDGIFTLTKEIPAGTYGFKLTSKVGDKDEVWYGNSGSFTDTTLPSQGGWEFTTSGGDCTLNASGGTYEFRLNTADMKLTVLYTAPMPVCALKGTFNSWADDLFVDNGDGTATITKELLPGEYEFKITVDGTWRGNTGEINDTTVGTSEGGWKFSTDAGNCKLNASGGLYEFILDVAEKKLTVLYTPMKNGLVFENDGSIRFYENDRIVYSKGLVKDDEDNIYYINSTGKAVKNTHYTFSTAKANGLVEKGGTYRFDENGHMQFPRQGLVFENGVVRYYENDQIVYSKGLVKDDEDNIYYINSTGKAVKNTNYTFSTAKTNGLLPKGGTYHFDEYGHLCLAT